MSSQAELITSSRAVPGGKFAKPHDVTTCREISFLPRKQRFGYAHKTPLVPSGHKSQRLASACSCSATSTELCSAGWDLTWRCLEKMSWCFQSALKMKPMLCRQESWLLAAAHWQPKLKGGRDAQCLLAQALLSRSSSLPHSQPLVREQFVTPAGWAGWEGLPWAEQ